MSGAAALIGGAAPVELRIADSATPGPAFLEAMVLPGRGMMLLQARLRLPSGAIADALTAPPADEAAQVMNGGPDDFAGNRSFSFGGAILAPFANRIRGALIAGHRDIETPIAGHSVRLPANWSGRAPGAERYAMHGLILDSAFAVGERASAQVRAELDAGDFHGHWPGRMRIAVTWRLARGALILRAEATNTGATPTPVGFGWHPYFRLPSGDRRQARLRVAARSRVCVNNYDDVLPTGEVERISGGPYDFADPRGRALDEIYLDDCFTDLDGDGLLAELCDPAARLGLRLTSAAEAVRAIQIFAPPEAPFVVIEPQFNLADPFGAQWRGRDTGMRCLEPGERARYEVRVEPFVLPD